jgi:hypothetical protein
VRQLSQNDSCARGQEEEYAPEYILWRHNGWQQASGGCVGGACCFGFVRYISLHCSRHSTWPCQWRTIDCSIPVSISAVMCHQLKHLRNPFLLAASERQARRGIINPGTFVDRYDVGEGMKAITAFFRRFRPTLMDACSLVPADDQYCQTLSRASTDNRSYAGDSLLVPLHLYMFQHRPLQHSIGHRNLR